MTNSSTGLPAHDPATEPSTAGPAPPPSGMRWRDGDTMLSFGVFALVVLSLMAMRVADPSNWIAVSAAAPLTPSCHSVVE